MNPYIKSLGFMDIMSDSKEKTPTVSPDPGATGETATSDRDGKGRWRRALIVDFNKIMAETHPEVWRQFQLFIEKERPREHEACGIEVAEDREMVGPPPKKTKGEKAEETTENVHEDSMDYNKFYSKFIQRALDTIGDKFDLIQNHIDNHGVFSQIEKKHYWVH